LTKKLLPREKTPERSSGSRKGAKKPYPRNWGARRRPRQEKSRTGKTTTGAGESQKKEEKGTTRGRRSKGGEKGGPTAKEGRKEKKSSTPENQEKSSELGARKRRVEPKENWEPRERGELDQNTRGGGKAGNFFL